MFAAASQRFPLLLRFAILLPLPLLVFLFASRGLDDADFWWHVRGGQWILETGQLPDKDPFSYASAEERWIDIYWLFQVALALTYARGAAAGVIVLGGVLASLAILVGLTSRGKSANALILALCWVPGILIIGARLPVRPELVTLLFIAADLAILKWAAKWPRLVWALPLIQLVWVNCHGLFIFGPILVAFWWLEIGGRWLMSLRGEQPPVSPFVMPSREMKIASALVVLACFINPYGLSGAALPMTLYPKVSEAGNPYREHIAELQSTAHYFAKSSRAASAKGQPPEVLDRSLSTRLMFLLLPLSFLVPTAWRLNDRDFSKPPAPQPANQLANKRAGPAWIAVFAGAVGLSLVDAAAAAWQNPPPSVELLRLLAPCLFLVAGGMGYLLLPNKSAKGFSVTAGISMSLWTWWLEGYFAEAVPTTASALLTPLAVYLVVMIVRAGGSLFALVLCFSFGFLALGALYNLGRFGLVGAIVLSWNLGDWAAEIQSRAPQPSPKWLWPALEAITGVGLWLWFGAALAGIEGVPGSLRPGAFEEPPLLFPHDAARFAGQPGMPPRVLAYGLSAANVFVFHNGPDRKVFMDARLEVPSETTFLAYRDLEEKLINGNPRWTAALAKMGNPVLILDHNDNRYGAQATVLVHPDWRLVYHDALAAVFLPRGKSDRETERKFPTLDLAARHFAENGTKTGPADPIALDKKSIALGNLGLALCRYPDSAWSARIPVLLSALECAQKSETERGAPTAALKFSIGISCWAIQPDTLSSRPQEGWVPYSDLRWSQMTFALRQARELDPGDSRYLGAFYKIFQNRGLIDAQRTLGMALLATGTLEIRDAEALQQQIGWITPPTDLARVPAEKAEQTVLELARAGRPDDATRLAESVGETVWSRWDASATDALADAWMRLGYPDRARHVWQQAAKPASEPLRQARVAATLWVERKLAAAAEAYESARRLDPSLAEAHWALAWINTERGLAGPAMADCQKALACNLPDPVRAELTSLAAFLRNHVSLDPK